MKYGLSLLGGVCCMWGVYSMAFGEVIETNSISDSTVRSFSDSKSTIKSPPASAISPTINTSNSDLCTVGVAGAVQTQILGISAGKTVRDMNCERLKNAKTLYDLGMKVAAVSVMCQDKRVFDAMMNAGTPCPYDGMIGSDAKAAWKANQNSQPDSLARDESDNKGNSYGMDDETKTLLGGAGISALLFLLLL
jgi:hypothetical protein